MTIVVECACGRKLRAPNQMGGKYAACVCGEQILLPAPEPADPLAPVEPEFEEADESLIQAPVIPRLRAGPAKVFQPAVGREKSVTTVGGPLHPTRKKRKRRQERETATARKRRGEESIFSGLKRSFLFPLRTESLLTIGLLAVVYSMFTSVVSFLPGGVFGGGFRMMVFVFMGTIMILGYFAHFLFQVFRIASVDDDDLPLAMDFDQDSILTDLGNWIAAAWWSFSPYAAYLFIADGLGPLGRAPELRIALLAVCGTLLPMALMSAALHLQWLASNPWTAVTAILRTAVEYGLYMAMFGVLCLVPISVVYVLPPIPESIPVVSHLIFWVLMFYAVTSAAYGFGNFYFRNRKRIGWFRELPPVI